MAFAIDLGARLGRLLRSYTESGLANPQTVGKALDLAGTAYAGVAEIAQNAPATPISLDIGGSYGLKSNDEGLTFKRDGSLEVKVDRRKVTAFLGYLATQAKGIGQGLQRGSLQLGSQEIRLSELGEFASSLLAAQNIKKELPPEVLRGCIITSNGTVQVDANALVILREILGTENAEKFLQSLKDISQKATETINPQPKTEDEKPPENPPQAAV